MLHFYLSLKNDSRHHIPGFHTIGLQKIKEKPSAHHANMYSNILINFTL